MVQPKRVFFHTLGCKLNFSETSSIARQFEEKGHQRVEMNEHPDVVIINTCSVTENADKEARYIIRKAQRNFPKAFIAVTGCAAQLKPELFATIPGVDAVFGSREKFKIFDYLPEFQKNGDAKVITSSHNELERFESSYSFGDRTRSFLKVQDGCDYSCSFCTIPLARGGSRSDTIENTVRQAEEIAAKGVKEVVLTGVNVGDFGPPLTSPPRFARSGYAKAKKGGNNNAFIHLIAMLDKVSGIERFRISSIEPNLLGNEIIDFVAQSKKFMPHFHIPLQSGSDKILKLMRRRYLKEWYAERVAKIKEWMPHCCIGADVITGFPGETEEDFLETYRFLNELDVSYLHVFTFSERENTDAAKMKNPVPVPERQQRTKMLINLSVRKRRYFYGQHLGTERPVLFEGENKNGFMNGWTDNYIRVKTIYNAVSVNRVQKQSLVTIGNDGLICCFVPS